MTRAVELEFLPAVLEIEESPPLPAARYIAWSLMAFFAIALGWACIGTVDIVTVAPGKFVPSGRTKVVQPLSAGTVLAIHVRDGDQVEAGQILIELDPTETQADGTRLGAERLQLQLDAARLDALLAAMEAEGSASPPALPDSIAATPALTAQTQARLTQDWAGYKASYAALQNEREEKAAERAATEERIARLDATLPLVTERAMAAQTIAERQLGSRVEWLALEQARIEQAKERNVQHRELERLTASVASSRERLAALRAQYRSQWLKERQEVETRLSGYAQEIIKSDQRLSLQRLTAPVAGTVQQLAVHTVGGVVTPAQTLMAIVPDGAALTVEALIPNPDIGFVRAGQAAIIKVDTFPFTKYGHIEGEVRHVSNDAVTDERHGLVYTALVAPSRTTMDIDGRTVRLAAGMAVSVEVKSGERRLIEFITSPISKRFQESARER